MSTSPPSVSCNCAIEMELNNQRCLFRPKMYKNQFARWNFFKYSIKKRPRHQSDSSSDKSGDELVVVDRRDALDGLVTPLLHENEGTRVMQAGLTAVRHFLHGYVDQDTAHLKEEVVIGYQDPSYRYFKTAMDLFDLKENVLGGRILRLAFLQIEQKVASPDIKTFSDLCFLIPHLLLESNRKDILSAYLQYLTRLVAVKYGKHPLTDMVAALAELIDRPEDIIRYITALADINSDTISGLGSEVLERTKQWAKNQSVACRRSISDLDGASSAGSSPSSTALVPVTGVPNPAKHAHYMIRLEAQGVYWAQNLVMQSPESDELAEQWLHRNFSDDFAPRAERLYNEVQAQRMAGTFIQGDIFGRMMECLYCGWLNDYYETQQDWPKVFEWGRKGLELSSNEQYVIWSIHLEHLMREHGTTEEAEELKRRRQEHQWFESVRLQVDRLSLG